MNLGFNVLFCFRYKAILHPFEYSQQRMGANKHKQAKIYIIACWVVAAAVGIPILFGLNKSSGMLECGFYNPGFIIVSSIASFFIPCIIIIGLYCRIMKVSTLEFRKFIHGFKDK